MHFPRLRIPQLPVIPSVGASMWGFIPQIRPYLQRLLPRGGTVWVWAGCERRTKAQPNLRKWRLKRLVSAVAGSRLFQWTLASGADTKCALDYEWVDGRRCPPAGLTRKRRCLLNAKRASGRPFAHPFVSVARRPEQGKRVVGQVQKWFRCVSRMCGRSRAVWRAARSPVQTN